MTPDARRDAPSPARALPALLSALALLATGALMASLSWLRWPDLMVDYGRDLYVAWRISAGEMLYRDLPHLYGPLAAYANALLFALFGPGIRTLVAFNLLLVAALTWTLFGVFRRRFGPLTATLCGMTFLGTFAFGRYYDAGSSNFVAPYAHEVTYGIALFFLAVRAWEIHLERGSTRWAAAAGALLGGVCLTKVEVAVAALGAAAAVVLVAAVRARPLRLGGGRGAIAALLGFAAPPLFFLGLFASGGATLRDAAAMTLESFRSLGRAPIVTDQFYRVLAGLDRPAHNTLVVAGVAAVYLALGAIVFAIGRIAVRFPAGARRGAFAAVAILPLCAAAFLFGRHDLWWLFSGRPWPLFLAAYVLFLAGRGGTTPDAARDGRGDEPLLAITVFALLLLLKIVLGVQFALYGFALAMPAALIVVALVTHHLPLAVERRGGDRGAARVASAALVLTWLAANMLTAASRYASVTYPVGRGADRILTLDPSASDIGPVVAETLAAIETHMSADAGFVVIPDGVMLNYLARRRSPGRWFEFAPSFVAEIGEERIRADLERGRPDYVVLTSQATAEEGADFGVDYGFALKDWVVANYTPVFHAGAKLFSKGGYGIAIARRNSPPRP